MGEPEVKPKPTELAFPSMLTARACVSFPDPIYSSMYKELSRGLQCEGTPSLTSSLLFSCSTCNSVNLLPMPVLWRVSSVAPLSRLTSRSSHTWLPFHEQAHFCCLFFPRPYPKVTYSKLQTQQINLNCYMWLGKDLPGSSFYTPASLVHHVHCPCPKSIERSNQWIWLRGNIIFK